MPPFAIGRAVWDNWMIYHMRQRGVPIVDGTTAITAIHQDHGYRHVPQSKGGWAGPESERNLQLAGGRTRAYCLADATHRLTDRGVVRRVTLQPLRRALGLTGGLRAALGRLRR
jgi:hypothetical protein